IRDRSVTGVQPCALPIYAFGPCQLQPRFQRKPLHHATIMSFDARSRAPQIRARAVAQRKSCERGKNRGKRACKVTHFFERENPRSEERRVGKEKTTRGRR